MRNLRRFTRTILAGGFSEPIGAYGKWITISSISASTIELSIDDDSPTELMNGMQITVPEPYRQILLRNTGGAASTVIGYLSLEQIVDTRGMAMGAGIAASLAAIDLDTDNLALILVDTTAIAVSAAAIDLDLELLKPGTVPVQIDPRVIPLDPAADVQLVNAAAALDKGIMLQAGDGNTDNVYLGFTAGNDAAQHFGVLHPGETLMIPHNVSVFARCAVGAGAANEVHGYAIA